MDIAHSSDGRHLDCFHFLAIMTSACTYVYLLEYLFSILLDIYLGVELLGHIVFLCLMFQRIARLFSSLFSRVSIIQYIQENFYCSTGIRYLYL